MSILSRFANKTFCALIRLYPASFRQEFQTEMTADFIDASFESRNFGLSTYFRFLIFEYNHIIRTALQLHIERFRHRNLFDSNEWERPPSWIESIVTLSVFVLPGLTLTMNISLTSHGFAFWAGLSLCTVLLFGLLNGLPRWSLPYLGLALSAISFTYIFQWTADLTATFPMQYLGWTAQFPSQQLVIQTIWAGFAWVSLFTTTYLVLRLLAYLRLFQLTIQRIHQDWTHASFILYSGSILTLFVSFAKYHRNQEFVLSSTLCLLAGAWMYLNCKQPVQRVLSLTAGASLALIAAAAGLIPQLPGAEWTIGVLSQPDATNDVMAIRKLLLDLVWLLILILAPAFFHILPDDPAQNTSRRVI